jgi:hypothetical protein
VCVCVCVCVHYFSKTMSDGQAVPWCENVCRINYSADWCACVYMYVCVRACVRVRVRVRCSSLWQAKSWRAGILLESRVPVQDRVTLFFRGLFSREVNIVVLLVSSTSMEFLCLLHRLYNSSVFYKHAAPYLYAGRQKSSCCSSSLILFVSTEHSPDGDHIG